MHGSGDDTSRAGWFRVSKPAVTRERLAAVLANNQGLVDAWFANEPGAWGKLAAAGVMAERRAQGSALTDAERREVWRELWAQLEALRANREL